MYVLCNYLSYAVFMLMPILHADSACIMGLAVSLFWVSTYHEDVEKSVESRMDC